MKKSVVIDEMTRRRFPAGQWVPVSKRALIQRINRVLEKREGSRLKTQRGGGAALKKTGRYYIVSLNDGNGIEWTHVNLETFGEELGVLKDYELSEEEEER